MELVYDRRHSRDARREAKKLDRMDRDRGDARDGHSGDRIAKDVGGEHRENSDVPFKAVPFGGPGVVGTDEIANELLQEIIGEGVHDGSLRHADDIILGPLGPEDPNDDDGTGADPGSPLIEELPPGGK